jgi:putative tryptophan/tyrosine transport system substrate-binding protein
LKHLFLSGRVVVCLAMLFTLAHVPVADAAEVLVVKSKDFALYDKAVAGFQSVYKGSISTLVMKGSLADPGKLADAVRKEKPKAILAVGLRAAKALKAEISDIPIVFCMAMHPVQNKLKSDNSTGVDLEPKAKDQLLAFKRVVPGLKRVGIIYDPKRTGRFVNGAKKAAAEAGLTLVAKPVDERKDVPGALSAITSSAQALWLIRDATVLTREFFNHTLIVQFEKKIPLLAYSEQFVRKGSVCSFAATYPSQGRKAAEIVRAVLAGTNIGDIPIQAPEGTLTINLNSAQKAGLKIPGSLLNDPKIKKVK